MATIKMTRMVVLLLAAVAVVAAEELVAVVRLVPHDQAVKDVTGNLKLTQEPPNGPVKITGKIVGLTEGFHGFHVHEKGDLSDGCTTTGAHFNPENVSHGAPGDKISHAGDLGNIEANASGEADIDISTMSISLSGPHNILGRAFVVHSGEDDLGKGNHTLSLTTGNAGSRWACGIVGVMSPLGSWESSASLLAPGLPLLLVPLFSILRQLNP